MSISWQTGEPPRGVELLIEFEYEGNGRRMVSILDDEVLTRICILRWSTLDDDRAAMAMWALEKYIDAHPDDSVDLSKIDGKYVAVLSDSCGYLYADSKREAPSLIEAIEKLTEDGNDSR